MTTLASGAPSESTVLSVTACGASTCSPASRSQLRNSSCGAAGTSVVSKAGSSSGNDGQPRRLLTNPDPATRTYPRSSQPVSGIGRQSSQYHSRVLGWVEQGGEAGVGLGQRVQVERRGGGQQLVGSGTGEQFAELVGHRGLVAVHGVADRHLH